MNTRKLVKPVLLAVLIGLMVINQLAQASEYPNPPTLLTSEIDSVAKNIVVLLRRASVAQAVDQLNMIWDKPAVLAALDALGQEGQNPLRSVPPYIYAGEFRRVDKQIGASSGSSGSTSLVEKAGLPELLAFAIENGAVQQEARGTSMTLSTSPVAIMALLTKDDLETYDNYSFWQRFGLSASFPMDATTSDSLGSFDPRAISEWSLQFRILGNRSTRSKEYVRTWKSEIQPIIVNYLVNLNETDKLLWVGALKHQDSIAKSAAKEDIRAYLTTAEHVPDDQKISAIRALILQRLYEDIYLPVKNDKSLVSDRARDELVKRQIPELLRSQKEYEAIDTRIDQMIESINRSFLLTFKFTNHRELVGTNYSVLKLLADGFVDPVDLILNAGIALNHHPDASLNQSTVRQFDLSASLQLHFDNFFSNPLHAIDESRITLSGSGKYMRLENVDDDMGVFQAKLDIPFSSGLSLPFSVTYATRTELIDESDVRGNFGISFDLDKLYAAARSSLEN